MSRRYAPDHKRLVLKIMKDFKWDIHNAARYTGVPERTLREWRRELRKQALRSRLAASQQSTIAKQQRRP